MLRNTVKCKHFQCKASNKCKRPFTLLRPHYETCRHTLTPADKELDISHSAYIFASNKNKKPMKIISIEATAFEEMQRALSLVVQNIQSHKEKRQKEALTDWIDNQEACIMMDISLRKLLTLRRTGKIPYSRIDRKIYYRKKDIITYMEKQLQKGND